MKALTRLFLFITMVLVFNYISAQNQIQKFEYWFNDNYHQRVTTNIIPSVHYHLSAQIPASSLPDGIHCLNIRFLDDSSRYSGTVSSLFLKFGGNAAYQQNHLTAYEYWFDHDYSTAVLVPVTNLTLFEMNAGFITNHLQPGIHSMSIRFSDATGLWSGVKTSLFMKYSQEYSSTQGLSELQYWFDGNVALASSVPLSGNMNEHIISPFDTDGLQNGIHTFSFRVRDYTGLWSSVASSFFVRLIEFADTASGIAEMQYWFDDDFHSAISLPLNGLQTEFVMMPVPAQTLNDGFHKVNIRFRDNSGLWSSVLGRFFHKNGSQLNALTNLVTSCRYWFDEQAQDAHYLHFQNPMNPIEIISQIDMTGMRKGFYDFHIQFKDTLGQWSSVLSQGIEKVPFPIAEFEAYNTHVCFGETVFFNNTSIDGDVYLWSFGDGSFSSDSSAYHIYSAPGLYTVSLTVSDTLVLRDSTLTLSDYIYVGTIAFPDLTFVGNDSICAGATTQIHAQAGNLNYLRSTGDTTQFITVGQQGVYAVMMTDQILPACLSFSDTVIITVINPPLVNLGNDTSQCTGTVLLNAGNPGATYQWQDNSAGQTFNATQTGTYSVTVTNWFGCQSADTVEVTIYDLPVVSLGPDIIQLNPPVVLDAGNGFSQYLWSTGSMSQTITVSLNGNYSVTVTDNNGCQNSDAVTVTFTAGLNDLNSMASDFILFPNPAVDYLIFVPLNMKPGDYIISVFDLNGRRIFEKPYSVEFPEEQIEIPVESLPQGCYRIVMNSGSAISSRNFIISR